VPKPDFKSKRDPELILFRSVSDSICYRCENIFDSFLGMEMLVSSVELQMPLLEFSPFDTFDPDVDSDFTDVISELHEERGRISSMASRKWQGSKRQRLFPRGREDHVLTRIPAAQLSAFAQALLSHADQSYSTAGSSLLPDMKSGNLPSSGNSAGPGVTDFHAATQSGNEYAGREEVRGSGIASGAGLLMDEFAEAVIDAERSVLRAEGRSALSKDGMQGPAKSVHFSELDSMQSDSPAGAMPESSGRFEPESTASLEAGEGKKASVAGGSVEALSSLSQIEALARELVDSNPVRKNATSGMGATAEPLPSGTAFRRGDRDASASAGSDFDAHVVRLFRDSHGAETQVASAGREDAMQSRVGGAFAVTGAEQQSMTSDMLTSLVNDALVEQARRHGVDLS